VRIGVVSDTHLPRFGQALPRALRDGLHEAGVDLIVHLGDFTEPAVAELFGAIAPFEAVAGNNDPPELVAAYGRHRVIVVAGVRIGLTHGDLGRGRTTPERAVSSFATEAVDLILFGHSHIPLLRRVTDGPWLLNPGSPTDRRRQRRYSWGLVELTAAGAIQPELRFFDDRRV
jgi:putative phosphoesterase